MGTPPRMLCSVVLGCFRDDALRNRTVNYGPSSGPRDAEGEKVAIETLVNITKIYALAAAEICGVSIAS